MVDLGVPETHLRGELEKLSVRHEFNLTFEQASKQGIHGTKAKVTTNETTSHRHLSEIRKIIQTSKYPESIEASALSIFDAIAVAEGQIHSVSPEKIHFHEVGALDSIVDIVGAAICLDFLSPEIILCNPVEVGSGFVDCAHGRFPVPAPATQELLKNTPCTYGGVTGESTTPTGAAILRANVNQYQPQGIFTPDHIGYGIGHKDFELPNVLRVATGRYEQAKMQDRQHVKIEANIDDMNPESFDPLMKTLFEVGASDVYLSSIFMKKNRPAQCLNVLCEAKNTQVITDSILNNSSTIGLRILPFEKIVLPRQELRLATTQGEVRIKQVTQPNGKLRWKSEHDDLVSIANRTGENYQSVKQTVDFEISQILSKETHSK